MKKDMYDSLSSETEWGKDKKYIDLFRDLSPALTSAFTWDDSEQGREYWSELHGVLRKLVREYDDFEQQLECNETSEEVITLNGKKYKLIKGE